MPTSSSTLRDTPTPAAAWRRSARDHAARARLWTGPALERRARGERHPVHDFLFTYYFVPARKLEQWHPPAGTPLEIDDRLPEWLDAPPYERRGGSVIADPAAMPEKTRTGIRWVRQLLEATAGRPGNFACHGLHEWAMVYRGEEVRHRERCPLRLPQREIDEVVESRPIACSHYDAFRFFHADAQPLNRLQPDFASRMHHEQPGCVHANMDLYKWASKCMPWVGSDLQLATFELAVELRELDMRASPYDLSAFGYEPIRIESADGRRVYEDRQRELAERAGGLRQRLIGTLAAVLESA